MYSNKIKKNNSLRGQAAISLNDNSFKARHLKGQAAMEYLMTYGWAILVIVIVLAALWFLSGQFFKPPENCLFSQPGLSCGDTKPTIFNEGGVVKVSIQMFNQQGQNVKVHQVLCTNAAIGDVKRNWGTKFVSDLNVPAGGSVKFLTGSDSPTVDCISKPGTPSTPVSIAVGGDFRGQFVVWYNFDNDVDQSVWRQASAAITGSVREK
ncbi:MAG: hypothetical protein Q7S22_05730 [Candidatus Micrarchaeota archaeon]|nr:hypothetical protein [Candidatus Micrarchaeota archaeon]